MNLKAVPGKMKSHVKTHDMFGHIINLNFDRQGFSHKTFIGGIFSIIIKLFMYWYVLFLLQKFFWNLNDSITTYK